MLYKICILSVGLLIHGPACSRVVDVHSQQALNVSDYCPKIGECGEGSHVMCLYTSDRVMGPGCYDYLTNMTITPDYAYYILNITNRIRSRVANGEVKALGGKIFPRAYGMFRVEWDEELATFAQIWANQCILRQDMCRSSKRFPYVGQALGMIRLSLDDWMPIHNSNFSEPYLTPAKMKYAIKQVMRAWWDMKVSLVPEDMQLYNHSEVKLHDNKFLNLVYGPLTHVGCGMSVFKEYAYKDNMADLFFNCIQIVCNFSSRPKVGRPIYTVGSPSKPGYTVRCGCPVGYDEDDDCLCYKTGRKLPYSCKDKDQCKPPVVVLPIFTVGNAPLVDNRNKNTTLKVVRNDAVDDKALNKRIPSNNYNDIFTTNLEAVDYKRDLTRKFPIDVRSRYFDEEHKISSNNITKDTYHLADTSHDRRHLLRQKPSIFSRVGTFKLPVKESKQVTMKVVHHAKEIKKDVQPRKDFTKIKKLVSRYLDQKRHRKPFDTDVVSESYMSHGDVAEYNNATDLKIEENRNNRVNSINYNSNLNVNKDNFKQPHVNPQQESDVKLMSLLDKLEEEVKNIDLNTNEKGMFDQKIRKIYGSLVGKPDLNNQKYKILSKDFANESITGNTNFNKLLDIDKMKNDDYGFDRNTLKYNYHNFGNYNSVTNYENKLEKLYDKKFFNGEIKPFPDRDLQNGLRGFNDVQRKFRNIHDLREIRNKEVNRYSRIAGDEYYPLGSKRRRYYHQKLADLQKKVQNMKANDLPKEVPEDRHIRPVRPSNVEKQHRRRRPNDHINSYYMPDRARFLHGF